MSHRRVEVVLSASAVALAEWVGAVGGLNRAARILKLSAPTVLNYIRGRMRPSATGRWGNRRQRIQRLTHGYVRADGWLLPHERAEQAA